MVDSWWTFGRQNLLACEIHHLHYSTDEIRCKSTKPLQCPYKYPTKSLHFLYWHLAGGVAFSKYNFEKFKGLGMFPNKKLGKVGPRFHCLQSSKCIYVYTACQYCFWILWSRGVTRLCFLRIGKYRLNLLERNICICYNSYVHKIMCS